MLEDYIHRFAHLRTNRNNQRWSSDTDYRAPYKPLLLLSVIDLFALGQINSNLIEITSDLIDLFRLYWTQIIPLEQKANLAMPFYHLTGDGFWQLVLKSDKNAKNDLSYLSQSVPQLQNEVFGAQLNDELYQLLMDENSREVLRQALIQTYFVPEKQLLLIKQATLNASTYKYSQYLLELVRRNIYQEKYEKDLPRTIRDQGFRRALVIAYKNRCSLCGIRIVTSEGHTVVEGAHIIPWSISYNDDPRNGLALCPLCHWAFDEGLLSISSSYTVMTSSGMQINGNIPGHLAMLSDRDMIYPSEKLYLPKQENLAWHREQIFRAN